MNICFIILNERPMLPYNYSLFRSYCEQDESLRGFNWQVIYDAKEKTSDIMKFDRNNTILKKLINEVLENNRKYIQKGVSH